MLRLIYCLVVLGLFRATRAQVNDSIKGIVDDLFNPDIETKNPGVTPVPGTGDCQCVQYYLCNNDSSINTNGMGIIDIRGDEDRPCRNYLEFCCTPPSITDKPITPRPIQKKGCGTRHADGVGFRITGDKDNEAQFGELPWMTAVLREEHIEGTDDVLSIYQCGGALIHQQVVLTAAHCVNAKDKVFKVRVGEWDTQTTKEIFPHQDRLVKTIIIHPKFYEPAVFNDVALLVLDSPVDLADNVDVVCLPPQDYVFPAGTRCFASGWGKDLFGKEGKYQVILKRIELPLVEHSDCQSRLRTTRLGKFFELDKSFTCAGGEPGKDTCKGDGGSPLVCPIPGHPNQYQHAGIVAWGIGCGENGIPGVYANVALFRSWIDEQLAQQNLDTTVYQY